MKKTMKVFVSLLICGLLLLTGCTTISTSLPNELVGKTGEYPETLNIIAPYFFWDRRTTDDNAENAKQQWLDEMSERYGVDINVISNSYAEDGTFNSAYKAQTETFSGLVQTEDMYVLQSAIDSNSAVPLDDYLADNAIWNALPESIKSTYKVNGHIYAIPSYVTNFMYMRIMGKT